MDLINLRYHISFSAVHVHAVKLYYYLRCKVAVSQMFCCLVTETPLFLLEIFSIFFYPSSGDVNCVVSICDEVFLKVAAFEGYN